MTQASTRRAVLLGLALTATACDLAQFVIDPKPRFEETWNLPGPDTRMSVADLLPAGTVAIKADSSAFLLTMSATSISAVLGPNCPACINGISQIKPAFSMSPSNSTTLPTDIVSAAVTAGQIDIAVVNNLTFDPLYVNTGGGSPPQGSMIIRVRSVSVVLGEDTVFGAAVASGSKFRPFPAASTLNRTIILNTGLVTSSLTVDVIVNSPGGDHLEFINTTRTISATATVPNIEVSSVSMNVPGRTFDSGDNSIDVPFSGDQITGMGIDMTITNPFTTLSGGLSLVFTSSGGGAPIIKPVTLPAGTGLRTVSLNTAESQALLSGGDLSIKLTGTMNAGAPITVTPKQEVKIANRINIKMLTPSGKEN